MGTSRAPLVLCLAAAASALASAADASQRLTVAELRAAYEESAAKCRHGHASGVIIHLAEESPEPEQYLETLRARAIDGDEMKHHYKVTLRAVAAKLSASSLDRVFADNHTVSVAADCIFYIHKIAREHLGGRAAALAARSTAASLLAKTQLAAGRVQAADSGDAGVSAMSGVEKRDSTGSQFWNWGPDRIDAASGTDDRYTFGQATGKGTVLYTIDTGVYVDHDEFVGRVVDGYSIGCPTGAEKECGGRWLHKGHITSDVLSKSRFVSDSGEACDSHGTHTASTAAGHLYGVAKEAEVVVVQGLDCNGTASNSMFIAALDWAVGDAQKRGKPAVMTMSLGGDRDASLDQAARRAAQAGFAVVTASGNDGGDSCDMSPGADEAAISVAASDRDDSLALYSNRGKCTNLVAPGSNIVAACIGSSPDSAASLSGTSMATPHVAGAVLQLLQAHPTYQPADISRALDCMATKGVIKHLPAGTPDRLLHTGAYLDAPSSVRILDQFGKKASSGVDLDVDVRSQVLAAPECHPESHPELDDAVAAEYAPAAGALQP